MGWGGGHDAAVRLACVAALIALALVLSPAAGAHLSVKPAFLEAGIAQELAVTVHNDRDATMSGFELELPADFRIVSISTTPGWTGGVDGRIATWTGGELEPDTPVTFELSLETPPAPGSAELRGGQLYPDGEAVEWPLDMTVVPAMEADDGFSWATLWFVGLAGVCTLATIGYLLMRRRATT
jgi:uncharacterized protein YcnI